MPGPRLKLEMPEVASIIEELHLKERDGWRKNRLLMVKLVARGEHTSAQIADLCGFTQGSFFRLLKVLRVGGLEALLERKKPGPKWGVMRGLEPEVAEQLSARLAKGEFLTAVQVQRWLKEVHQVEESYLQVWRWLKKAGGVLLVPRPSHSRKNPGDAEKFKSQLAEKLAALELPAGARVKLWMMDEARFGLHTQMRRVWAIKGQRPVLARQTKYQWDYLYGSLGVLGGETHFLQMPTVNLDCDRIYLEALAATDPQAIHVVIRDQAGFHLRDGDARLPERIRTISLPPYSPELNPCEQLWDIIKDQIGNRVYQTIEELRDATLPALQRYWDDAKSVIKLVGREWIQVQANASDQTQLSY